jgi:Tfp pilus assembly protein PilN
MKLELNFVRPPRHHAWQGPLLLLAGIAAAGFGAQQYYAAAGEIATLERQLAAQSSAAGGRGGSSADTERLRSRIVLANQVVRRKTVPWDGLFRDIESASDENIGLLAVQPDAVTGLVRLSGEARDAEALTNYIGRLEAQPSLKNVHLADHEVKVNRGRPVVRFSLSATWKGAQL